MNVTDCVTWIEVQAHFLMEGDRLKRGRDFECVL